ncbi:hypothetical protein FXO37_33625, partial [Capsicum annuum]
MSYGVSEYGRSGIESDETGYGKNSTHDSDVYGSGGYGTKIVTGHAKKSEYKDKSSSYGSGYGNDSGGRGTKIVSGHAKKSGYEDKSLGYGSGYGNESCGYGTKIVSYYGSGLGNDSGGYRTKTVPDYESGRYETKNVSNYAKKSEYADNSLVMGLVTEITLVDMELKLYRIMGLVTLVDMGPK